MALFARNIVLGLGFFLAFSACGEGPASPDSVPNAVVKEGVRFRAVATAGDNPLELNVQVELLNASTSNRHLTWGGCAIGIRLYRSDSLVYDSKKAAEACDDILHGLGVLPAEVKLLTESFRPDPSRVSSRQYDVILVFEGKINDVPVQLEVRAGVVDL